MYTVLAIDDDDDMRALLSIMLEQYGCHTVGAENGTDGIAEALKINPDLILLDIMMDDVKGYDVCTTLRAYGYTGRIVLLSAVPPDIGRGRARACGANDFVGKPISARMLKSQLEAAQIMVEA
jgi:DNA-binding response OmpR family regulator